MATQKPIVLENATNDLSVIVAGDYIDPTSLASGTPSSVTFLRGDNVWSSSPVNKTGDTMTGQLIIATTTGAIAQSAGNLAKLQVTSNGAATDAAFMQFHRPGYFAAYLGLDTDNFFKVGGWTAGGVSNKLFHEGYFPSSAVTTALGFTPYNATNPAAYISSAGAPVQSVAGRIGAVVLGFADVTGAAPLASPSLTGIPLTPTAAPGTNTTQIANTAFVTAAISTAASVTSFNTRTGAITLSSTDVTGALTFTPYNSTNPANYITSAGAPVQSVAGRVGAVVLANTDVSGLGTMSVQNASAVAVVGGTINGTSIGATTPSTGAFTTLTLTNTTALAQNAVFAYGNDGGFKLTAANGTATNAAGQEVSSFGIRYAGAAALATGLSFIRGINSTDSYFDFWSNSAVQGRLANTGNWLLGTTTDDGSNKLQVAGSGKFTGNLATLGVFTSRGITDNANSTVLIISSAGNTTFGIAAPYNVSTDVLTASRNQNLTTQFVIDNQNAGTSSSAGLAIQAYGASWFLQVPSSSNNTNPLLFRNGSTEVARFTSSGRLLLGTTTDDGSNKLQVAGGATITGTLNASGVITSAGGYYNAAAAGNQIIQTTTNSLAIGGGFWAGGVPYLYSTGTLYVKVGATLTASSAPSGGTDVLAISPTGLAITGMLSTTSTITAPTFSGSLSGNASTASTATTIGITTDDLTATSNYITFNRTSGPAQTQYNSSKLSFVPSTGSLTVTGGLTAQALDATGTAAVYSAGGGLGVYGHAGSTYGRIQAYSNTSGLGKSLALNSTGGNVLVNTLIDDGVNALQINGSTKVTGTLSVTGAISSSLQVNIIRDGADTIGDGPFLQLRNVANTRSWVQQLSASNNMDWWYYGGAWSKYMTLSSTGLAVTGILSATQSLLVGQDGVLPTNGYNISGPAFGGAIELRTNGATTNRGFRLGMRDSGTGFTPIITYLDSDTTVRIATGLAVTGALSATGSVGASGAITPSSTSIVNAASFASVGLRIDGSYANFGDKRPIVFGSSGGISAAIVGGRGASGWLSEIDIYCNAITSGPNGVDAIQKIATFSSTGLAVTGALSATGTVTAPTFIGALSGNASTATTIGITTDNTTATPNYVTFNRTSGASQAQYNSNNLSFVPSTGTLIANAFTDGFTTFSAAQINRAGGYVEAQFSAQGGFRIFAATAYPITMFASGNTALGSNTDDGVNKLQVNGSVKIVGALVTYQSGLYDSTVKRYFDVSGDFAGTNAATQSNAGALTGIRIGSAGIAGKHAMIAAVSEDPIGFSRTTGLSFYSAAVDTAPAERGRFSGRGALLLNTISDDGVNQLQVNGSAVAGRYSNTGFLGSSPGNARNHFQQFTAGNAGITSGWIAAAFGDATTDRVVIGQAVVPGSPYNAIIAAHNANLTDWAPLSFIARGYQFRSPVNSYSQMVAIDPSGNVLIGDQGISTYSGGQRILNIQASTGANAAIAQVISGNADAWITLYSGLNVSDGAAIIRPLGSTLRFARATSSAGTANFVPDVIISGGGRLLVNTSTDDGVNQLQISGSATLGGQITSSGSIRGGFSIGPISSTAAFPPSLEVRSDSAATSSAYMVFHRPGNFAAFLGIDTDNKFKVGGFSMGANAYALYHEGNKPAKADVGLGSVDNTSDATKNIGGTAANASALGNVPAASFVRNDTTSGIFGLFTFTKSLQVTTAWQDVGISSANLDSGSYMVQMYVSDFSQGGTQYVMTYTGSMSWFGSQTNSTTSSEIVLHSSGHAANGSVTYLRVLSSVVADGTNARLQIAGNYSNNAVTSIILKFRRLI